MTGTSRAVIRVAGDARVGFGHVRRCWTLAGRLQALQIQPVFVASSAEAAAVLTRAGHEAVVAGAGLDTTLRRLGEAPRAVAVVDDPDLGAEDLRRLRQAAPVACIDDTAERELPVDLVLNASAGAVDLAYRGADTTRWLLGPTYALLRPEFVHDPARPAARSRPARVLVLTGGGDSGALVADLARAVHEVLPDASVDVVVGPFVSGASARVEGPAWLTAHRDPPDVRALMLAADLAVTAGGQTAYELAATATPALGLRVADNQIPNLRGLAKAGCLRDLGSPADRGFWPHLRDEIADVAAQPGVRAEMGRCGRALVDGRGAERVAAAVAALVAG